MKLLYRLSALVSLPGPNRSITFTYEGIGTAGNNPNGLPVNARVYNGAPPVYTPVTTSHIFLGLGALVYTAQYKDTVVEKILSQIDLSSPPSCITSASTFQINIIRNVGANGLKLILTHLGTGSPSEVWFTLDNGVTWTKMVAAFGGGSFNYTVSDAVLDSLAFGDNIPNIKFRYGTSGCIIPFGPLFIGDVVFGPLVVDGVKTDVTVSGGSDGSIVLNVSGGTGNYLFSWADGPTTQNRGSLPAGTYTVTVSDVDPSVTPVEVSFDILEPEPPQPKPGTFIRFPELNSLKFVVQQVVNNCNVLQGLDNVLFCERVLPPNWYRQSYYQRYQFCDTVISQFESDFSDFLCQLIDYSTREVVAQYTPFLKEDNLSTFEDFTVTIRNHSLGQSRVYFNAGTPPIPISVGMNFQILNNPDGFDGSYSVVAVNIDTTLGYAYLVINLNYTSPDPTSPATARFFGTTVDFNVFEILSNFGAVPEGRYQVRIEGVDIGVPSGIFGISEPIDLKEYQPGTNLLEYRNNDNFSITWKTGYIGRMRVPSVFEQGLPTSDLSTTRGSNFNPININGKPRRVMLLQTYSLPRYMHEKLALIFTCDFKFVNGEGYGNIETYGEVQWIKNSPLGNSAIKLEFLNWIEKYNSDDIGTVGDGFITTIDGGFFKRLEP